VGLLRPTVPTFAGQAYTMLLTVDSAHTKAGRCAAGASELTKRDVFGVHVHVVGKIPKPRRKSLWVWRQPAQRITSRVFLFPAAVYLIVPSNRRSRWSCMEARKTVHAPEMTQARNTYCCL
jgi:hypothetical protein